MSTPAKSFKAVESTPEEQIDFRIHAQKLTAWAVKHGHEAPKLQVLESEDELRKYTVTIVVKTDPEKHRNPQNASASANHIADALDDLKCKLRNKSISATGYREV